MSFENKAEQVGVLGSYAENPSDVGKNWGSPVNISLTIRSGAYLGNGIAIYGTEIGHIFRSVDYGVTWTDLGQKSGAFASIINCISYIGNGIVIFTTNDHVFRSVDYGITWSIVATIGGGITLYQCIYLGNGVALTGDDVGNIYRSVDFGATWAGVVGNPISTAFVDRFIYYDNGIVTFNDDASHIFRSVNFGANWTDLGIVTTGTSYNAIGSYLSNGIAIYGDINGHIFRTVDNGLTWKDLGILISNEPYTSVYLGNGVVLIGDAGPAASPGHIWRSTDYGLMWTDLGGKAFNNNIIRQLIYYGNGVVTFGEGGGYTVRSDVSYKLDECMPSISVGISTGGNTSGTTGLVYQRLVIAGGNNVTLSQSITSGSATLTISAGAGGGGGTYVSLFQPAQGMDLTSPGLALDVQNINFYRVSMPASIVATQYDVIGSMVLASNSTGGYTFSYGVYTMTGSTANLVSSGSVGSTFTSGSNTNSSGRYGGQSGRRFRSASLASWNIVPGDYLFAVGFKTANNVSMSLIGPHKISVLDIPGGGNYTKYFYDGAISSAGAYTALPSSVNLTNITRTGDNLHVWWMALAGTF